MPVRATNSTRSVLLQLRSIHPLALRFWLCYLGAGLLLWLIFGLAVPAAVHNSRAQQAKGNLHMVQLALERFAVDSAGNHYPRDLSPLFAEGYLTELPLNPFSGESMRSLPLGSEIPPGDFVYEPLYDGDDRRGAPSGYSLHSNL